MGGSCPAQSTFIIKIKYEIKYCKLICTDIRLQLSFSFNFSRRSSEASADQDLKGKGYGFGFGIGDNRVCARVGWVLCWFRRNFQVWLSQIGVVSGFRLKYQEFLQQLFLVKFQVSGI